MSGAFSNIKDINGNIIKEGDRIKYSEEELGVFVEEYYRVAYKEGRWILVSEEDWEYNASLNDIWPLEIVNEPTP